MEFTDDNRMKISLNNRLVYDCHEDDFNEDQLPIVAEALAKENLPEDEVNAIIGYFRDYLFKKQ